MKKVLIISILSLMLSLTFTSPGIASALETTALIPHIEIITPGVTRTIIVTQTADYPQDFSPFIVFLIGDGSFKISISKDETVGDRLKMSGVGISPAGVIPFYKSGKADVNLVITVEIGNERYPYGMVLFSSWVSGTVIQEPDSEGIYHNTYEVKLQF